MPRISPIYALTAAAPEAAADVQTDVIGDGLEDEDGDGASTAVMEEDVTPLSSWVLLFDMASTFASMVGINPDTWGESKRFNLPTIFFPVCHWTALAFAVTQVSTHHLNNLLKTIKPFTISRFL